MQTRLSKIFLYANATLKPISEDAGTFLWVPLSSEIFILVPIIPPSGEERDNIIYFRDIFFPIFLVVCPKREGSWWQGKVYGEDGALNPASNNHYQLGTGSLISGKK